MRNPVKFLIALYAVSILPALGSHALADGPAKLRISYPTTYSTNFLPYLCAIEMGWLKQEGVETEDLILNSDANATRALLTDAVDIVYTGPLNFFNVLESGAALKWIGSWQMVVDYDVVAGPNIESMNDLQDKMFATSGPSGLPQDLPVMLFKKLGIPSDRAKFVAVGSHSARLQAVIAKKADAALVNEVTAQFGIRSGKVHIVASVPDYFPKLGYTVLGVRTESLKDPKKRDALVGFMRASIKGARFVVQNPDRAAEILHSRVPDLDTSLIATVVKRLNALNVWATNGGIDADVIDFTADIERQLGQIKQAFTADQVVDSSIVNSALKDIDK